MTGYPTELDGLRWEKDASTRAGYLIFDRPPMNVVSFQARAQIASIIAAMDDDPEVRVIVIRGANGVYSSGGDIAGFLKVGKDGMHDLHWNVAAPERAKKPVIAAIEKWAMGVAFELALAADFRLATENTQLGIARDQSRHHAWERRDRTHRASGRADPRQGDDHARPPHLGAGSVELGPDHRSGAGWRHGRVGRALGGGHGRASASAADGTQANLELNL